MAKYNYPHCFEADTVEDWFGTQLPDPYSWLRDKNDPSTLDFVAQENAFTDTFFSQGAVMQMKEALRRDAVKALPGNITPWKDAYIGTLVQDGEYNIQVLDAQLKVLTDLPRISDLEGLPIYRAEACPNDPDILAMMIQYPGAARPSLAVCRMSSGQVLQVFHNLFSFCWCCGDGAIYYASTQCSAALQQSHSVFCKYIPSSNTHSVVYQDDGFSIFGQVHASRDGRYVLAEVCQDYALAHWIAVDTQDNCSVRLNSQPAEWKYLDSLHGQHYFITLSQTERGAVIGHDGKTQTTVLAESNLVLKDGFSVNGQLFLLAMEDVSSRLVRVSDGGTIPLANSFGSLEITGWTDKGILLRFESFVDSPRIMQFDGENISLVLISSEATHSDLVVEQFFAPSTQDKTPIPYYIVHRKDAKKNGTNPTFMHAYGGYNVELTPQYTERISGLQIARWVEKGGIYIQCNIRGGSEYGPQWHAQGMMMNKRHCYEDFIGVAEDIIQQGWTNPSKLAICGCSNGGLLMSVLVTMRPDLWGCVLDSVPHTDMIHFVDDDRGPMYITEYGNPRQSREMFQYLLSYSPYHQVKQANYPPIYIQTGELDNNVPPYHGKKFAAQMQKNNCSEHPILLRVLAEGSHDRGKGEIYWQTIAEMQLFLQYSMEGLI